MRFQNPTNGHIEEFGEATWLWVLVGGPFYLAYKQIWLHAVIAAVLSLFTAGLSWLLLGARQGSCRLIHAALS